MDLEEITQRLEWLDNERRKDKLTIATLEERLAVLSEGLPGLKEEISDLSSELARMRVALTRFEQIEASVAQVRVDLTRAIEAVDRQRIDRDREVEKTRLADFETIQRSIAEVRKTQESLPELKRSIQARIEEDFRLSRLIEEVNKKITDYRRGDEEYKRALKVFEENQRQDNKRLTDLQGEIVAFRKRIEEQRGRHDVTSDMLRKFEARLGDLQASESERRQAQAVFVDRVSMQLVDRDRIWKEWQARFDTIEKQSVNLDTQLQTLDATYRSFRRSEEEFDEMTERFERRINEISELQRLTEERFRQEWVSFKADDQKRWTNYTLAYDEQKKEELRLFSRIEERLVVLEDVSQEVHDLISVTMQDSQQRLQSLLTLARSWVEESEQANNRVR